jgi:hypothetical protein
LSKYQCALTGKCFNSIEDIRDCCNNNICGYKNNKIQSKIQQIDINKLMIDIIKDYNSNKVIDKFKKSMNLKTNDIDDVKFGSNKLFR